MKQFSIIHIPPLSFFSKDLCRDIALNWRGVNFLYLLLLLAVCWIPLIIKLDKSFSQFIDEDIPPIVNQIPEIKITNGEVSIKEAQPYYIKGPKNDKALAIIDTTGTITSLDVSDAKCLVTKTAVTTRESPYQTRTFNLTNVKNFVLTRDDVTGWAKTCKKLFIPVVYPFALISSFIYRIIQVLLYAGIGILFATRRNIFLSYAAMLRLSVVAVTPCIIISTVLLSAQVSLQYDYLIYFLLAMAYLLFGIKAASAAASERQTQPPANSEI